MRTHCKPPLPPILAYEIIPSSWLYRECTSIYETFQSELAKRIKGMTVDEIANVLHLYAYANRSDNRFFREIETELLSRELEFVPVHLVGKILKAFSYSNLGSSMVYAKISKTIKLTQHETLPMALASYAYLFSKASENMSAGFGVYQIAQKQVLEHLRSLEFKDCVKIAKYMISSHVGNNDFCRSIEEKLVKEYPPEIEPAQLVNLCKYLSKVKKEDS